MTINKLKPEMLVYDVRKQTGLPGMFRKWGSYNVVVKEINKYI